MLTKSTNGKINRKLWTIIIVLVTAAIIFLGQYKYIDRAASYLAVILSVAVLAAAISVFPQVGELGSGLAPQLPSDVKFSEVLPWLGFMLAGAAGLMWYSYWVEARGYGAAPLNEQVDPKSLDNEQTERLSDWLNMMTLSNTLAVVGALLIAIAFLILGGELLRPEGLVPQEKGKGKLTTNY